MLSKAVICNERQKLFPQVPVQDAGHIRRCHSGTSTAVCAAQPAASGGFCRPWLEAEGVLQGRGGHYC